MMPSLKAFIFEKNVKNLYSYILRYYLYSKGEYVKTNFSLINSLQIKLTLHYKFFNKSSLRPENFEYYTELRKCLKPKTFLFQNVPKDFFNVSYVVLFYS